MKPKVIAIVGPTASGKTQMAIDLAKQVNGEVVSNLAFDVSEKNKNLNVSIIIKDIDNHIWKNKTIFTLGEIDEKLLYATTAE